MGYSETTKFTLAQGGIPTPEEGEQHLYFFAQAFPIVGVVADGIAKAQYLNTQTKVAGSEWSKPADVSIA